MAGGGARQGRAELEWGPGCQRTCTVHMERPQALKSHPELPFFEATVLTLVLSWTWFCLRNWANLSPGRWDPEMWLLLTFWRVAAGTFATQVSRVCFSFLPPMKKNIRCYRIHPTRLPWRCLWRKQTGTFPEQWQRQNSRKGRRAWRCRGNQASGLCSRFHVSNTVETSANSRRSRLSMWSLNASEGKYRMEVFIRWCENVASNSQDRWCTRFGLSRD